MNHLSLEQCTSLPCWNPKSHFHRQLKCFPIYKATSCFPPHSLVAISPYTTTRQSLEPGVHPRSSVRRWWVQNKCLVGLAFTDLCCSKMFPLHFALAWVSTQLCQTASACWPRFFFPPFFNWLSIHYTRSSIQLSIQPHQLLTSAQGRSRKRPPTLQKQTVA